MSRPDWRIFNADQPKVKKGRQRPLLTSGLEKHYFCMDNSRTSSDWIRKKDNEGMAHGSGDGQERKRRGIRASGREHMDLPL